MMQKSTSLIDEIAADLNGLEQMKALLRSPKKVGIFESLKLEFAEVAKGRVVVAGIPDAHVYNPIGTVHGGYAATMLDSVCGCATHTMLQANQGYTTLELKVAYHRPITRETGQVRAIGEVMSAGRRVAFTEARIVDSQDRLLASATSTLLIMEKPTTSK
ncbi:thioesterase [Pseudomonas aeruginosa]|nr:thioesterase [Pseudomonas aeruginosa]KSL00422.1 thioesterase [Pseudomonas aeruginosa]MBF1859737.1 PaaI family thioesterase [Pseudomonas aeruginosa]MCO1840590.1 PaaI family thioesterase [Pseudomonas aeruginosa]MCO2576182.1 PaaI family thioesterase [Pseudomonas aeruginosa]